MSKTIKISEEQLKNVIKNQIYEDQDVETSAEPKAPKSGDLQLTVSKGLDGKFYVLKDAYTDNPKLVYVG